MMESADLGQRDDAAMRRWLDGARLGRILLEGEVSARPVVVPEVGSETTTEVPLVEDNHLVEQFASDGANDSLGEGVLPGRAWRSENLGRAHALHSSPELATVDAVAIAQ
jgi:hypothetical protein